MKYDVAIIGAGPSGLAAGIRLAHFDYKVCVLERHHRVGGLNSYYTKGGRAYDVGLHALTNCPSPRAKSTPWTKVLRQLRISPDLFELAPQVASSVRFPGKTLGFTNDPAFLEEEVAREFPRQIDGFRRLAAEMPGYGPGLSERVGVSAREALGSKLSDPLLIEMLLCPIMFYGSATEHDLDFAQFTILFQSIFLEGFCRPRRGAPVLFDALVGRFREQGGTLRLGDGARELQVKEGQVGPIVLDSGETIEADIVLSSAGAPETMALCGVEPTKADAPVGRLSFIETVCALDTEPKNLGFGHAITFYSDSERFAYRSPDDLVDYSSGVVCSPNNFQHAKPLPEGILRMTHMADYERWRALSGKAYKASKETARNSSVAAAERHGAEFGSHVVADDVMTPLTFERFTSRLGGAVYGSGVKRWDGTTRFDNLFLCGADQGWLGVVGAMVSGVTMANQHVIQKNLRRD